MVDDFDKSSREQRVNVGWHFKSVARVSAYGEFFKRSERERERESFNWRREGGDESYEGYVFDVQKVIMGWFPVIISRAH